MYRTLYCILFFLVSACSSNEESTSNETPSPPNNLVTVDEQDNGEQDNTEPSQDNCTVIDEQEGFSVICLCGSDKVIGKGETLVQAQSKAQESCAFFRQ